MLSRIRLPAPEPFLAPLLGYMTDAAQSIHRAPGSPCPSAYKSKCFSSDDRPSALLRTLVIASNQYQRFVPPFSVHSPERYGEYCVQQLPAGAHQQRDAVDFPKHKASSAADKWVDAGLLRHANISSSTAHIPAPAPCAQRGSSPVHQSCSISTALPTF